MGNYFQITEGEINKAIADYNPSNNRCQLVQSKKTGNTILWDAYNANPTSMLAAIENVGGDVLILGDMLELGKHTDAEHLSIIEKIKADKNAQRGEFTVIIGK